MQSCFSSLLVIIERTLQSNEITNYLYMNWFVVPKSSYYCRLFMKNNAADPFAFSIRTIGTYTNTEL